RGGGGGGPPLVLGSLLALLGGPARTAPLGAALSLTLLVIVMIALIFYVRAAGNEGNAHG
ncbi:MAG: ABC transporter permease, partial [Rhodobacterales bacterium]